jgi:hypothetical protein
MTPIHIGLIVVSAVILYLLMAGIAYRKIVRLDPRQNYQVVNQSDAFFTPSWEWYKSVPKDTVHIRSYDGVRLSATFIPSADKNSELLAIVQHGYHANSTDMAAIAKFYSDLGFKILLPDFRGHGLSGGTFCSFGVYEQYDLRKWINYCLRIYGSNDKVLLHGVSMGASTILMAAGKSVPENIKLIVADSPYTKFMKVLRKMAKPKIGILLFPGLHLITYFLHRFTIHQADALKATRKITFPTVFIHGDHDYVCPPAMESELFHALPSTKKDHLIVKNAPHGEGYVADKDGVESFLLDKLVMFFGVKRPKPSKR